MFDIAPSEFMLVAVVALVVIGPKDLPRAMRFVGQWVGRARGVARQFRSGFDEVVRQAEVEEMEKKWAAENARIMAEHPTVPAEESEDAYYAMAPSPPELPAPEANPETVEHKPTDAQEPVTDSGRQDPVARS